MAGIYVHIPFCKQACHYCNFHFSTNLSYKEAFIESIIKEVSLRKDYLQNDIVNTIYFGGGTPSLLKTQEINKIIQAISETFSIGENPEVTIEVNPDDIALKDNVYLRELRSTGVNRVSIGIQSFEKKDLEFMNRSHNNKQAYFALENCLSAGFDNISADLIYGTPSLSDKSWERNLFRLLEFGVPHISAYALTVEEKTALHSFIKSGKINAIDEVKVAAHFEMLVEILTNSSFIHYEISNFALEGFISKHNSGYWKNQNYLGLGPSAHSYNGKSRQWNVSNNHIYIRQISEKAPKYEVETLSKETKYNEYILTSLRTMWGVDPIYIRDNFGKTLEYHFYRLAEKHLNNSVEIIDNKYILTKSGKLFADRVASDLFTD